MNHSQAAIWPENKAVAVAGEEIAQPERRHQGRDDVGDEDHRVAGQLARIEFDERIVRGAASSDLAVEERGACVFG